MISQVLYPLIHAILGLLLVVLIVYVVISWLYAFDIVSRRNAFVRSVWAFTSAITEPMVRPLRRLIPPIAGVDLSVLVLMLIIVLVRDSVLPWLVNLIVAGGPVL
jgi:YggT family protein